MVRASWLLIGLLLLPAWLWAQPVITAGPDRTIVFPVKDLPIFGQATHPTHLPMTQAWSMVSGPAAVTYSKQSGVANTISFTTAGTYVFRLTVSDGTSTVTDDATVTVLDESAATVFYMDPTYTGGANDGSAAHPWTALGSTSSAAPWMAINAALATRPVVVYLSARQASTDTPETQAASFAILRSDTGPYLLIFDGMSQYNTNDSAGSWAANTGTTVYHIRRSGGSGFGLGWESEPNSATTLPNHGKKNDIIVRGVDITDDGTVSARVHLGGSRVTLEYVTIHDIHKLGATILAHACHKYRSNQAWSCADTGTMDSFTIRRSRIERGYGEGIYIACNYQPNIDIACPDKADGHQNVLIEENIIDSPGKNGGESDCIDIKANVFNMTIRGNILTNCAPNGGDGISNTGVYVPTVSQDQNLVIEDNVILGVKQSGIALVNVKYAMVRNNVVSGTTDNNHALIGTNTGSFASIGLSVSNNTLFNPGALLASSISFVNVTSGVAKNNLLISGFRGGIGCTNSSGVTTDYNLFAPARSTTNQCPDGGHSLTLADGNTLFVNSAANDFHLAAGSAAIAAGVDLTATGGVTDKEGKARPQGSPWALGAYELGGEGPPPEPPPVPPPVEPPSGVVLPLPATNLRIERQ